MKDAKTYPNVLGKLAALVAGDAQRELPTYGDLIAHFNTVEAPQMGEQQVKNRLSALSLWMKFNGRVECSPVGQELGDNEFSSTLNRWDASAKADGSGEGTRKNRRTFVGQWKRTWEAFLVLQSQPVFSAFGEAADYFINRAIKNGLVSSRAEAFRRAGILRLTFLKRGGKALSPQWTKGFSTRYTEQVAELESVIGVPSTTLTRYANTEYWIRLAKNGNRCGTGEFSQRMSALRGSNFRLTRETLPESLLKEFRELVYFKTATSVIPLNRNRPWGLRDKREFRASEADFSLISIDGKKFSSTAIHALNTIKSFFGAAQQFRNLTSTSLNLGLLTDFELLRGYVNFMQNRHGKITETALLPLYLAKSLIYSNHEHGQLVNYGYLLQHPEYADRLLTPIPRSNWEEWCTSQTNLINRFLAELGKVKIVKIGRDVSQPIAEYLERQHPTTVMFELADEMRAFFTRHQNRMVDDYRRAFVRDILLVDIIVVQPLRIRQFGMMAYRNNNTGNLYQRQSGEWAIRFNPEDFKNESGAAMDKPYDVPLPPRLSKTIEHYLTQVRPHSGDKSDHVFVHFLTRFLGRELGITRTLSKIFTYRTKQFLPSGFGPHAVRHLVATDYIRNNPSGFQVAADVLHDQLATVLTSYAHVKAADGCRFYQTFLDGVHAEWRKAP